MELPEYLKHLIWKSHHHKLKTKSIAVRAAHSHILWTVWKVWQWPQGLQRCTAFTYSMLTLHRIRPPGHSLVILNGAQLTADISQGLQLLAPLWELHLYYWHRHGQYRRRRLLFTATINSRPHHCHNGGLSGEDANPAGSSECHLIKAMILFLPRQQHKYPHSRPRSPSIILEWR